MSESVVTMPTNMSAIDTKHIDVKQEECIKKDSSILTPWEVKGKINYLAQIEKFGTSAIDGNLIERWERVTRTKAHRFMRRGIVYSHQDINKILDCVEQGIPVYLYTGRGPSSDSMHMGHKIPFEFTAYLQKALNCIVIIQLSDDEKFLFKDGYGPLNLEHYRQLSYKNAQDIIACGFDPDMTYMFSNLESNSGSLYFNNVLIMKSTNMNQIKGTYGLGETLPDSVLNVLQNSLETETDSKTVTEIQGVIKKYSGKSANLGMCAWPAFQCGPAFCTSFKELFVSALKSTLRLKGDTMPSTVAKNMKKAIGELLKLGKTQSIMCLVPMAIDQAPYFRMARDSASVLGCHKPAVIHSEFLPGLKQSNGKMSSTSNNAENATLFLDMDPNLIAKTIKRHAFSGGRDTIEEHRMYGGNIKTDISYQYLTYFLESDEKLRDIAERYTSGELGSGQLKQITADLISNEIKRHQEAKSQVTQDVISHFFNPNRELNIGGCYDRPELDTTNGEYTDYDNYGINFDRTFGFQCRESE